MIWNSHIHRRKPHQTSRLQGKMPCYLEKESLSHIANIYAKKKFTLIIIFWKVILIKFFHINFYEVEKLLEVKTARDHWGWLAQVCLLSLSISLYLYILYTWNIFAYLQMFMYLFHWWQRFAIFVWRKCYIIENQQIINEFPSRMPRIFLGCRENGMFS